MYPYKVYLVTVAEPLARNAKARAEAGVLSGSAVAAVELITAVCTAQFECVCLTLRYAMIDE